MNYQTEWNETKPSSTTSHSSSKQKECEENELSGPWDEKWIAEFCDSDEDDEMLLMKCTKCGLRRGSAKMGNWGSGRRACFIR